MTRDEVIRQQAEHIRRVGYNIHEVASVLINRAIEHDASKWSESEWPYFEKATPLLASLKYGSQEYKDSIQSIKPATDHHYEVNSHHPESYENGIQGMSLIDLIEMLADWKASHLRHVPPGTFEESFRINVPRFKISPELENLLRNTVKQLGWE